MKQNKVCTNLAQDFTDAEKAQGRSNIGAVSAPEVSTAISNAIGQLDVSDNVTANQFVTSVSESDGRVSVTRRQPVIADVSGLQDELSRITPQVQSDWTQIDENLPSFIKNKPQNLVQDANYVHTDNNFTTTLKDKLDGIESGAQVNQNAFTNVKVGTTTIVADSKTDTLEIAPGTNIAITTDTANDKITIAATDTTYTAGTGLSLSNFQFSVTNPFTTADKTKLDGIAPGAEVNQNSFSNVKVGSTTIAADSKTDTLEIAAGSNVTLTPDASGDKVTIAAEDTKYTAGTGLTLSGTQFSVTNPFTTTEKTKLDGIAPGAQVNQNAFSNVKVGNTTVQADSTTDTLELAAGDNVTLTPDATNDKVTIAATDTKYAAGDGLVLNGTTFSLDTTYTDYKVPLMGATHAGSGDGSNSAFLYVPSRTTQGAWVQYSRHGATFTGSRGLMSGRFSFTAYLNLLSSFRDSDADGAIDFAYVFFPTNCSLVFPNYSPTTIDGGDGAIVPLSSAKKDSVIVDSTQIIITPDGGAVSYGFVVKWYFRISGYLTNTWEPPRQMSNNMVQCSPNNMLNDAINYRINAQAASWNPHSCGVGMCLQSFN